jgi:hypothetical protein
MTDVHPDGLDFYMQQVEVLQGLLKSHETRESQLEREAKATQQVICYLVEQAGGEVEVPDSVLRDTNVFLMETSRDTVDHVTRIRVVRI